MSKGIIFYTDGHVDPTIATFCRASLLMSQLPITSCSHEPMDFGNNFVLSGHKRGYATMVRQIIICLENAKEDYVFFCEHDVLYHQSHFNLNPPKDDVFYYNLNNWRWDYPKDRLINYDGLTSLSQMAVNREFALDHYHKRWQRIEAMGWDKEEQRDPYWARKMGYEPGTKRRGRGGFSDDKSERWVSEYPNIDIRHRKTFSPPKVNLDGFKHQPTGWREITLGQLPGWQLVNLGKLWQKTA